MKQVEPVIGAGLWVEGFLTAGDQFVFHADREVHGDFLLRPASDWENFLWCLMAAGRDLTHGICKSGKHPEGNRTRNVTPREAFRTFLERISESRGNSNLPLKAPMLLFDQTPATLPGTVDLGLEESGSSRWYQPRLKEFDHAARTIFRASQILRLATTCDPDGNLDLARLRKEARPLMVRDLSGKGVRQAHKHVGGQPCYTFLPGERSWIDPEANVAPTPDGGLIPTVSDYGTDNDGSLFRCNPGQASQLYDRPERWQDDAELPGLALMEIDCWLNFAVARCTHLATFSSMDPMSGKSPFSAPTEHEDREALLFGDKQQMGVNFDIHLVSRPKGLLELAQVIWFWTRGKMAFCTECGTPFVLQRKKSMYCSSACKQRASRRARANRKPKTE